MNEKNVDRILNIVVLPGSAAKDQLIEGTTRMK